MTTLSRVGISLGLGPAGRLPATLLALPASPGGLRVRLTEWCRFGLRRDRKRRGGAAGAEVVPFALAEPHELMPRASARAGAVAGSPRGARDGREDGEGLGPEDLRKGEGAEPGAGRKARPARGSRSGAVSEPAA